MTALVCQVETAQGVCGCWGQTRAELQHHLVAAHHLAPDFWTVFVTVAEVTTEDVSGLDEEP